MRHLVIHDPDAYKDSLVVRANENHQLIDDEEEESEEDDDPDMILPTEDESLDQQTLQFTLDPQTHQMLQGGEQVVVFEVVQMNNNESGNEDQQNAYAELANFETPKKGATVTKKALAKAMATTNGGPGLENNIIIQLQTEDDEAANAIQEDNIIDDADYTPNRPIKITTLPANALLGPTGAVPPPIISEDTKTMREHLQKQKDMADCFGFKDDDEEDEAILSMPAAHAQ
jgi:hypothetical protein